MKPQGFFLAAVLPPVAYHVTAHALHALASRVPWDRAQAPWERALVAVADGAMWWMPVATIAAFVSAPLLTLIAVRVLRPPLHGRAGMAGAWPWLAGALAAFGAAVLILLATSLSTAMMLLATLLMFCHGAARAIVMAFVFRAQDVLEERGASRVTGWGLICIAELLWPLTPLVMLAALVPLFMSRRVPQPLAA